MSIEFFWSNHELLYNKIVSLCSNISQELWEIISLTTNYWRHEVSTHLDISERRNHLRDEGNIIYAYYQSEWFRKCQFSLKIPNTCSLELWKIWDQRPGYEKSLEQNGILWKDYVTKEQITIHNIDRYEQKIINAIQSLKGIEQETKDAIFKINMENWLDVHKN